MTYEVDALMLKAKMVLKGYNITTSISPTGHFIPDLKSQTHSHFAS